MYQFCWNMKCIQVLRHEYKVQPLYYSRILRAARKEDYLEPMWQH